MEKNKDCDHKWEFITEKNVIGEQEAIVRIFWCSKCGTERLTNMDDRTNLDQKIEKMKNWKTMPVIGCKETDDINPNQILAKAFEELEEVVISGIDKEGEYYFASSVSDGKDILWLLEKCKQMLLEIT